MSFDTPQNKIVTPLLWSVQIPDSGGNIALQIQDSMLSKGVSKRIIFSPKDSTWTMLISFNKVKNGTRIHAAAMFRDTLKHRKFIYRETKIRKVIDGYNCKKMTVESDKYTAEVWYTDKIKFDLCGVYRLISHCGLMNEYARKGDWFMNRNLKYMVLEVISVNKTTNESYTVHISEINSIVNPDFFYSNGYKIADIPEGQNCGVKIKDD